MKILHVETGQHLYGGAKQVEFLLSELRKRGIDNVLCAPKGSDIAERATAIGIRCETTDSAGDADLGFLWQARKIMSKEQPDIVHLHSRRGADVLGGIASRSLGLPTVLSRRVDNKEPIWFVKLKYRLYDHVITISQGIRDVLLREGVSNDKISCVHSSVDAALYQQPASRDSFLKTFELPEQALTLGVIAQLIPRKGHRYLLQVLPVLVKQHPQLHILIFGKGPLAEELQVQVLEAGLQEHVHFTGFRDDIPKWLGCLDLVVHPADIEGLGVSLLQAAAAGVPIIASRTGGIPEVVHHQKNGLLIDVGDTAALQSSIEQLLNEPETRKSMGQKGREIVSQSFSLTQMVEGNLSVYQHVLNTRYGSHQGTKG